MKCRSTKDVKQLDQQLEREIEGRKQAEAALRESEERYRLLADNVTDVIWTTDMNLRPTYLSPSFTRLTGYTVEDGMRRSIEESLTPASLEIARRAVGKARAMERSEEEDFTSGVLELEIKCKDGSTAWLESTVSFLRDDQGRKVGLLGINRNITERKRMEAQVRYQADLVENVFDAIISSDIDFNIVSWNKAAEAIYGWEADESIGRQVAEVTRTEYPCDRREEVLEQFFTKGYWEGEVVQRRKDGSPINVLASVSLIRDSHGNPVGAVAVNRDITERKRVEEELARHAKRTEAVYAIADATIQSLEVKEILEAAVKKVAEVANADAVGIYLLDVEAAELTLEAHRGVSEELTAAAGRIVPDSEEYDKGMRCVEPVFDIGKVASEARIGQLMEMMEREGLKTHCILPFWDKEVPLGAIVVANRSERQFAPDEIETLHAVGKQVGVGVKNARLYERERKLRLEVETEIKKRIEFTRALVHELKTPLTAVLASSELLMAHVPDGPLRQLAANLRRGATSLGNRIDELLDVARGELGMLRLRCALVQPLQLLHRVLDDMTPVVASRGQSLRLNVPSSLGTLWADEDRLRQVLFNLVGNASKYMTGKGTIIMRAREQDAHLVVEVQDTGPGIAEAEQKRLFNAYSRLVSDREHLSGLGLGLALSKTLVELHRGQIWVKSRKGKGSTFGFSIPLYVTA